ncbi:MAG: glycosyltransferase [Helicobacteraceae bacterium]|nr:glycosyltransferase [Helicobacteraceae bacterium]
MKIAFLSHLDLNLYLFRLPIMEALVKQGHEVFAICPRGDKFEEFEKYSVQAIEYKIQRQSLNPFKELKTIRNIFKVIKPLQLDILQNFTAKPNIYGSIAGHLAKVPMIVNAVTGLGSFYISETKKAKAIKIVMEKLYKEANKRVNFVIFQNSDDMSYFIEKKLVTKEKAVLIKSSGIDTKKFIATPTEKNEKVVVLMVARAIWHKGIKEYYRAAEILKEKSIEFILIGDTDEGNHSCAPKEFLQSGYVKWLGHRDDIKEQVNKCDIFVLPSYREGVPRTLLEATSMSKPIVTTDTVGCREVVDDGVNGFLVPLYDSKLLAIRVLELANDEALRRTMGRKGRAKAVNEFDVGIVVNKYLEVYKRSIDGSS